MAKPHRSSTGKDLAEVLQQKALELASAAAIVGLYVAAIDLGTHTRRDSEALHAAQKIIGDVHREIASLGEAMELEAIQ